MLSPDCQKCDEVQNVVNSLANQIDEFKRTMDSLKVRLYAKFGKNINLEEGD